MAVDDAQTDPPADEPTADGARAGAPDDSDGSDGSADDSEPTRRTRWRRALLAVAVCVLVLVAAVAGAGVYLVGRVSGDIDRVDDVFTGIDPATRPAPVTPASGGGEPLTFLVVGSDTRADVAAGELPDARADVVMLVRLAADRRHAQVVSVPRDSWVSVPGYGPAKVNAAYALGGPSLLVQTLEQLTGVRIDHYAAFDFQGFTTITDALGGVDVEVAETTQDRGYTFTAGTNHLDGAAALVYVRERYGLPGGDLDRVRRQQQVVRSMFAALRAKDVFADLGSLRTTLDAVTGSLAVDDTLGARGLVDVAWSLRDLGGDGVGYLTAPVAGFGREGAQSVVYLDAVRSDALWGHLREDTLADHLADFAVDALPAVPN